MKNISGVHPLPTKTDTPMIEIEIEVEDGVLQKCKECVVCQYMMLQISN